MNIHALEKVAFSNKSAALDLSFVKDKWEGIKHKIDKAKEWYETKATPEQRALIGAGVGLGGGAIVGKLMGRPRTGAAVGALAGAGTGAYWDRIRKAIEAAKPIVANTANKAKAKVSPALEAIKSKLSPAAGSQEQATQRAEEAAGVKNQ